MDDLRRAVPDHPQRDEGNDTEPDPSQPEQPVEQSRDIGRGDAHQRHRQYEPDRQDIRMIARHSRDRQHVVERHRQIGDDDLRHRLRCRLCAAPSGRRVQRARLVQTGQHARDISTDPGSVEPNQMLISTMPWSAAPISTRLGAYYAASFLVVGIQLPFWPVWLAGRGLDTQEIAGLFAAAIWAKVIATPLIGGLADRLGRRRGVMVALAAVACIAYAALWPAWGFWPLLWLNLVAGVAQSALMPLGDSITLAAVRGASLDYGRIRVWGSLSFIVAAIGAALCWPAIPRSQYPAIRCWHWCLPHRPCC